MKQQRADVYLVEHGYAASRKQAQEAISAGRVSANGIALIKPSQTIRQPARIEFTPAHPWVSRGGLKLIAALDHFSLSPQGRICLDVGSSTGGFTQVLLARGAARVYAVDVGHGQMHPTLAIDERVVVFEGLNARDLSTDRIPESVDAIVADVSFISLTLALPAALNLARRGGWLIALVKPQFEVGRAKLGKGGIVRDVGAREAALHDVVEWLSSLDWTVEGTIESPVAGGSGNREYLLAARRR